MRDAKRPTNPCVSCCCCIFTFPKANNCTRLLTRCWWWNSCHDRTHVLQYNFTHRQSRLYIFKRRPIRFNQSSDRRCSRKMGPALVVVILVVSLSLPQTGQASSFLNGIIIIVIIMTARGIDCFILTVDAAQGVKWRAARVDCWRLRPRPRSSAECRPTGVNFRSSSPWNLLAANNCAERRSWTSAGWPRPPTVSAGNQKMIQRLFAGG